MVLNEGKDTFPASSSEIDLSGYSWTKYFSNGENFFILPKKADTNLEILVQVFQGKVIKNVDK